MTYWYKVSKLLLLVTIFMICSGASEDNLEKRCPKKCVCVDTMVRCMFLHLNEIPNVPVSTTVLDLRFNRIPKILPNTFVNLKNLEILLLNNNQITRIEDGTFNGLTDLKLLYLYKNKIKHIGRDAFRNLPKLEKLYLHFNRLNYVDQNVFRGLISLRRLFLYNNHLESLPNGSLSDLNSLIRLRLDGNPLKCDCKLLWLAKLMKKRGSKTQVAATCQNPAHLRGKSVLQMSDYNLTCAYEKNKNLSKPNKEIVNNNILKEKYEVFKMKNEVSNAKDEVINKVKADYSNRNTLKDSKPLITEQPQNVTSEAGDDVTFSCDAVGQPIPEISWLKNNRKISSSQKYEIERGQLKIKNTSMDDAGEISCHATNRLGRDFAVAFLNVVAPLSFKKTPTDLFSREGGRATFSCRARGYPQPKILWLKNGDILNPSDRFHILDGGSSLRLENLRRTDEATYACRAQNSGSTIESSAFLYVRDKLSPIIQDEPRDTLASMGRSVEMHCQAMGFPGPNILWVKDGNVMDGNPEDHSTVTNDGTLLVHNVSSKDEGMYECTATNAVGYAKARAMLRIQADEAKHLGDEFFDASFEEARNNVNRAYNDTIGNLFRRTREKPPNARELLRIFRFPRYEGRNIAQVSETIEQTLEIIRRHVENGTNFNNTEFEYKDILSPRKLRILSEKSGCLIHRRPVFECEAMCFHLKYRTLDGTCNNLNNPMWGASLTGFNRELAPAYENGFNSPIGYQQTKKYFGHFKPSARTVSTRLLSSDYMSGDNRCTHMLMQWGQFLDHDMDHALPSISTESFETGESCEHTCSYSPPCFPIKIPTDDPRVRHRCMEFTRSSAVCGSGESSVVFDKIYHREQINQLTSFIDASQIYSSSNAELRLLRNLSYPYGEMNSGILSENGKPLLPFSNGSPIDCRRNFSESVIDCFLAGDVRANEQVGLISMHTLWFREHNRIAGELRTLNPHWDGDTIFHESRKIIGAMMQHITYTQWLPHIIGAKGMENLGPYTGYNPNTNPSIANVFATAAFRFGHTLINPELERLNASFQRIPEGHLPLHKAFFSPWRIVEEGGIDPILRGLFVTPVKYKRPGQFMTSELTEKLFENSHQVAFDLASMNVQRGRDHGLPGYIEWRKFCNLSIPNTFNDLSADISSRQVRSKLRQIYGHPGNMDLFVGGILEDPINGGRVGPTFSCLIIKQFRNLRQGDRFWYENPSVFKPGQLTEIKQSSVGRVMCDSADNITDVTPDVFVLPQRQSPTFTPCKNIPKMNLKLWADCCSDCRNTGFFNSLIGSRRFKRSLRNYPASISNETLVENLEFGKKFARAFENSATFANASVKNTKMYGNENNLINGSKDLLLKTSTDFDVKSNVGNLLEYSENLIKKLRNSKKSLEKPKYSKNLITKSDNFSDKSKNSAMKSQNNNENFKSHDSTEKYSQDALEKRLEALESLLENVLISLQNLEEK